MTDGGRYARLVVRAPAAAVATTAADRNISSAPSALARAVHHRDFFGGEPEAWVSHSNQPEALLDSLALDRSLQFERSRVPQHMAHLAM